MTPRLLHCLLPCLMTALGVGAAGAATPASPLAAAASAPAPDRSTIARGVVRAVGEATISARMAARITALPLQEGRSFKKGDLLVAFDCDRPKAEARAAAAAVQVQLKMVETHEELDKFNAIGKNELLISRAQLDKARAESEALEFQLKECSLTAPFSGRVMERLARSFEAVQVSQPLLRIADVSELELDLIVPSVWLAWLKPGTAFQFRLDETGQTVKATVTRLGAAVDPVSKTLRITSAFARSGDSALPGMSGTATFNPPAR